MACDVSSFSDLARKVYEFRSRKVDRSHMQSSLMLSRILLNLGIQNRDSTLAEPRLPKGFKKQIENRIRDSTYIFKVLVAKFATSFPL